MPDIVLATINAKYAHASLALRCLYSHLGTLQPRSCLRELTLKSAPVEMADLLLSLEPKIVALGVYIWNVAATTELVLILKRLQPNLTIVLGGPEVSHEWETQPLVSAADYVICGEGEVSFHALCEQLLQGNPPSQKIIRGIAPELATAPLPYEHYTNEDLRDRIVYVEASRGCPFECEFCLSALDEKVRPVPIDRFLEAMQQLLDRGLTQFKFIDRTFNLKIDVARRILEFFLERLRPGLFLHFEMIPDRLPDALRSLLRQFPPGTIQLEIGIQTLDPEVSARISRRQNVARLEDNLRHLREHTGVHLHADLIIGLPGEDLETFGRGFNRLLQLAPHEIQVGMLKRLRGTPIRRHEQAYGLLFNPQAPYDILATAHIPFPQMQRLRRFARYWELFHNSGNFKRALPLLWENKSPFHTFLAFSDWLFEHTGRTHALSLETLTEAMLAYLTQQGVERMTAGSTVAADYFGAAPRRVPPFLVPFSAARPVLPKPTALPERQQRHARQSAS